MLCTLEGLEIWLPRACVSCFKVPDGSCEISTNYGPLVFGFYIWIFFIKPGLVAAQRHIVLHFLSSLLCLYFRTKVWTLDVNNFAACIKTTLKGLAKDNFLPAWRCEEASKTTSISFTRMKLLRPLKQTLIQFGTQDATTDNKGVSEKKNESRTWHLLIIYSWETHWKDLEWRVLQLPSQDFLPPHSVIFFLICCTGRKWFVITVTVAFKGCRRFVPVFVR